MPAAPLQALEPEGPARLLAVGVDGAAADGGLVGEVKGLVSDDGAGAVEVGGWGWGWGGYCLGDVFCGGDWLGLCCRLSII